MIDSKFADDLKYVYIGQDIYLNITPLRYVTWKYVMASEITSKLTVCSISISDKQHMTHQSFALMVLREDSIGVLWVEYGH